jgi:hypothetical protein
VYVTDRATGEHAVWFFGTTLGSPVVHIPRVLWRIPWHPARHAADCVYDPGARRSRATATRSIRRAAARAWNPPTARAAGLLPGFADADAQTLILTHPVDGYFYRLDGRLGTYSVWHPLISLTRAEPGELYFSLFERLGLLTREEMRRPHSALVCPRTRFKVLLPPRSV